jgi:twitching motility protein PilT
VLITTSAVRNMIREGKTRQLGNTLATGSREGMQTLEQSLNALVAAGSLEHAVASAASLSRTRSPAGADRTTFSALPARPVTSTPA